MKSGVSQLKSVKLYGYICLGIFSYKCGPNVPSSYEVSIFKLEMFINKRDGRASPWYRCYFSVDLLTRLGVFPFMAAKWEEMWGRSEFMVPLKQNVPGCFP